MIALEFDYIVKYYECFQIDIPDCVRGIYTQLSMVRSSDMKRIILPNNSVLKKIDEALLREKRWVYFPKFLN